jgi:hypothetical protein
MSSFKLRFLAVSTAAALLGACSSSNGPSSAGRQVAFQLATRSGAAAPAKALLAGQEILAAGSDTIVVTGVQMVLRRIELERAAASPVCDSLLADDDCEELKAGPVLLDLPLGVGAAHNFSVAMDTGSYAKVKFEIHRPEAGNDAAFLASHPGFDGVSIQMTGTFNGTPFTYSSDLDVEQEHEFTPPLTVTDSTGAQLTVFVDLQSWFLNQTADGLIDPSQANKGKTFEGEVKSNIETSLNAFEDENHDGEDDHDGI